MTGATTGGLQVTMLRNCHLFYSYNWPPAKRRGI